MSGERVPTMGDGFQSYGMIGVIAEVVDGTVTVDWDSFGGPLGSSRTTNIPTRALSWAENVSRWIA